LKRRAEPAGKIKKLDSQLESFLPVLNRIDQALPLFIYDRDSAHIPRRKSVSPYSNGVNCLGSSSMPSGLQPTTRRTRSSIPTSSLAMGRMLIQPARIYGYSPFSGSEEI
jgi:hypothetical protein